QTAFSCSDWFIICIIQIQKYKHNRFIPYLQIKKLSIHLIDTRFISHHFCKMVLCHLLGCDKNLIPFYFLVWFFFWRYFLSFRGRLLDLFMLTPCGVLSWPL